MAVTSATRISGPYPGRSSYPSGQALSRPPVPVAVLIDQVGRWTFIRPDGMVIFNEPLVNQITTYGDQAVPALGRFLSMVVPTPERYLPQVIEGLYLADRLAQTGVRSVTRLAPVVSSLNTHPNPLIQIYLAGFYRKINRPETFGPMLSTLIRESLNPTPGPANLLNPTEEVGGTLLQQIADRTSQETIKRLLPFLKLNDKSNDTV